MPYIVCTNLPGCLPESDPVAVATIEEARDVASEHVIGTPNTADGEVVLLRAVNALPETGSAIGPLPDGYVIDVQRVTYLELRKLAGLEPGAAYVHGDAAATRRNVIDAYNDR